jgi:hypothetical protein
MIKKQSLCRQSVFWGDGNSKGTPTQSGIDGPRNRSVVENFVWSDENGDYPEGSHVTC